MQHGDLDKTKVLKTHRDSKSDVRKVKFQECAKNVQLARLVLHIGQIGSQVREQVQSTKHVWSFHQLLERFIRLLRSWARLVR
jgi:hypothetical protein